MPDVSLIIYYGSLVFLGSVASIAMIAVSRKSYVRISMFSRMRRVVQNPELAGPLLKKKYRTGTLLRRSKLFEKFARKNGDEIITLSGIDEIWIRRLVSRKKKKDYVRVLRHAAEKGLFKCFLVSLQKKRYAGLLISWLEKTGDLLPMRRLSLAGKGEEFDGDAARGIFKDKMPEIREMMGDPEWASRYFAVKFLLHDSRDEKSSRALWEAFNDSHPLTRKTVASEFFTHEMDRLGEELNRLVLNDPVFEVRRACLERICREFPDSYKPDVEKLSEIQIFHVLELLRDGSQDDENIAMHFLPSDNLEFRFIAADYLNRNGALLRLVSGVNLGDRKDFERRYDLLKKSCEVNVTSFLSAIEHTENLGTLLLCANLLPDKGHRSYITTLANKAFALFEGNGGQPELYAKAAECISTRGNDEAIRLFDRELNKRRNDNAITILLPYVSGRGDEVMAKTLLSFLKDEEFAHDALLIDAIKRMPSYLILPEVFQLIKCGREECPHRIRMRALKALGEMNMEYCVQTVLENLPLLPLDEAREFIRVLSGYPREELVEKIEELLDTADAKLRASLIASIPAIGEKSFMKRIEQSLKDADPDVRIAGVSAIVDFEELKLLNEALSMLRDPVERVRSQVARVMGTYGSEAIIKELRTILFDEDETASVKRGAIEGLGHSRLTDSIDILISRLEAEEELTDEITRALALKTSKKEISRIIELFKDAGPELRRRITGVFKEMKEKGEKGLGDLLREDIRSLRPYIAEILESTGYVDSKIRSMSHRDPAVRKESAEMLSLVATKSAFRGIVLAARDPDDEVRVMVARAMEKLETKKGAEILSMLENDPDKRIRKYTRWAMERLRAKSL
jgi:HEAT repeat protein